MVQEMNILWGEGQVDELSLHSTNELFAPSPREAGKDLGLLNPIFCWDLKGHDRRGAQSLDRSRGTCLCAIPRSSPVLPPKKFCRVPWPIAAFLECQTWSSAFCLFQTFVIQIKLKTVKIFWINVCISKTEV